MASQDEIISKIFGTSVGWKSGNVYPADLDKIRQAMQLFADQVVEEKSINFANHVAKAVIKRCISMPITKEHYHQFYNDETII